MPKIKILTETELRSHVGLDLQTVKCVEDAFAALAGGKVVMPPILSMDIAEFNGEVDVKTAYVPGVESFAIKISLGFFDNPKLGLPSVNGLMVLFSAQTGILEAVLLDNGYLTDIRTAVAGAMAARHLSREDSEVVAIIGGGIQARLQLEALTRIRPIKQASIWPRDQEQASSTAAELSKTLGIDMSAAVSSEDAVRAADIIVTTTPSTEPLVDADWLGTGQHLTAMGSDNAHKNEVDPKAVGKADLFICDKQSQCEKLGELHHAIEAGIVSASVQHAEIGDIVAGKREGRTNEAQLTYCDLTGTGVQDTAIATMARQLCEAAGSGADFES